MSLPPVSIILQSVSATQEGKQLFGLVLTIFAGVFVLAGVVGIVQGLNRWRQYRRVAGGEPTPPADVEPGAVQVRATVRVPEDGETLEAPLSGREAVAVDLVEEYHDQNRYVPGFTHDESVPFHLEGDAGSVAVDPPEAARVELEPTVEEEFDFEAGPAAGVEDPDEAIREFVERHGDPDEDPDQLDRPSSQRYTEGIVEPGEEVYVLGAATEAGTEYARVAAAIDETTALGDFVLSDRSQEGLVAEMRAQAINSVGAGVVIIVIAAGIAGSYWLFYT